MANAKIPNHQLPVLAQLRVASPCRARWAEMAGDDRSRFCGECKTQVFNLSAMSREQAERLVIERNGDLCARYYQRGDGTILTTDCEAGARARHRTRVAMAAGMAAALIGGGGVAGNQLATAGPTPDALPELVLDSDAPQIEMAEIEGQPEVADDIQAVTDKLDADQVHLVLGKISVVDRDETLGKLELERAKLEQLRLEVK